MKSKPLLLFTRANSSKFTSGIKPQEELFNSADTLKACLQGSSFNFAIIKLLDIFISTVVLILLSPILFLLLILVKLDSPGPFIFKQKRLGKNYNAFTIYKIRTMVKNANIIKKRLLPLNESDGPVFKIKYDPRHTKIGRKLSILGIDEILQLVNVLKGEMSLVGPRPLPLDEARKIPSKYKKRFQVLPGVTSSWVISGSHNLTFDQWMKLDIEYSQKVSVQRYLQILFKTFMLIAVLLLTDYSTKYNDIQKWGKK